MKKLFFLTAMLFSIMACGGQEAKLQVIKNKEITKMNNSKKIKYGLSFYTSGPFEVYINNILVERFYEGGSVQMVVDINDWILGNGEHTFSVRYLPHLDNTEGILNPTDLRNNSVQLIKWEKDENENGVGRAKNIEYLKDYKIPVPTKPVPFVELKGTFTVNDLPYELEGWSNGEDFSKYKKEDLEKEVVAFYEKLRTLLNNGEGEKYVNYRKQYYEELVMHDYRDSIDISKNPSRINKYAKGNMIPIANYVMKIYGKHSQLVTLELLDMSARNRGVLKTQEPDGGARTYNVKLYRPKGSKDFVIIRM